jgi:hypothetical protein
MLGHGERFLAPQSGYPSDIVGSTTMIPKSYQYMGLIGDVR